MASDFIQDIEKEYLKTDLPDLYPGDTVKVMVRIKEGSKERLQGFEGVIIRISGHGTSKTMAVRRVFQGVGVERVFLLHSPKVESIKVLRRGDVRRAKLYYMRGRSGKAARIREKVGAMLPKDPSSKKGKAAAPATTVAPVVESSVVAPDVQDIQEAPEVVQEVQETAPEAVTQEITSAPEAPEAPEAAPEVVQEVAQEAPAAEPTEPSETETPAEES